MAVFGDLNIPWLSETQESGDRIQRALDYGYEVLALNCFVQELNVKTGKKEQMKQQQKEDEIKQPKYMLEEVRKKIADKGTSLYTRFTTVLTDHAQVNRLEKDPVIQSYDILSVQPTTDTLFHKACNELDVDIISLDFTRWLPFQLKHTSVRCALRRGIHFEIIYSPLLRDPHVIKNMIYNMAQLLDTCRGKNIIISSGCKEGFGLREPYSVISIGHMLGLKEIQSKAALTTNCRSVLFHAASRKTAKGVLSVTRASTLATGDLWKMSTDHTNEVEALQDEEAKEDTSLLEDELHPAKKIKLDLDVVKS